MKLTMNALWLGIRLYQAVEDRDADEDYRRKEEWSSECEGAIVEDITSHKESEIDELLTQLAAGVSTWAALETFIASSLDEYYDKRRTFRVQYEIRSYGTTTVEAWTEEEAQDLAADILDDDDMSGNNIDWDYNYSDADIEIEEDD